MGPWLGGPLSAYRTLFQHIRTQMLGGTSYPSIRYVGITTCLLVQWWGAIPAHVFF